MVTAHHTGPNPDQAQSPIVGRIEHWQPGELTPHSHAKHQLMYANKGVIHVSTTTGEWLLPPSRAIWINAGTQHSFRVKRPAETNVLYVNPKRYRLSEGQQCKVVNVSPLVRELILSCADLPWDQLNSAQERLAHVLIDQIQILDQAPVDLPLPTDPRALRVVRILRDEPANREPLNTLAKRVGASARTVERLFARETTLSFGAWRHQQRLIFAMERLAYGDSVTRVALDVGYKSASAFVVAFRAQFGTTPAQYFKAR